MWMSWNICIVSSNYRCPLFSDNKPFAQCKDFPSFVAALVNTIWSSDMVTSLVGAGCYIGWLIMAGYCHCWWIINIISGGQKDDGVLIYCTLPPIVVALTLGSISVEVIWCGIVTTVACSWMLTLSTNRDNLALMEWSMEHRIEPNVYLQSHFTFICTCTAMYRG